MKAEKKKEDFSLRISTCTPLKNILSLNVKYPHRNVWILWQLPFLLLLREGGNLWWDAPCRCSGVCLTASFLHNTVLTNDNAPAVFPKSNSSLEQLPWIWNNWSIINSDSECQAIQTLYNHHFGNSKLSFISAGCDTLIWKVIIPTGWVCKSLWKCIFYITTIGERKSNRWISRYISLQLNAVCVFFHSRKCVFIACSCRDTFFFFL